MSDRLSAASQYLVQRRLGQGGMGVVHLGSMVGPAGERKVAIKRLSSKMESDAAAMERMVAEARLVFRLTHANVCQVLDLALSDRGSFIVMEYVDGLDLRSLMGALKDRRIDVGVAVHIAREVARGLDYAHRRTDDEGQLLHLVHGDVAPQNILLSREGEVKLGDFGIARALGAHAPGNLLRGGTPGFVAPEVLASGTSDQRADLYSLGMVLYAMLTGLGGANRAVEINQLRERSDLSGELVSLIERLTAPQPDERLSSAAEVADLLSLHLARQFPAFTSAELSRLVRTHAQAKEESDRSPRIGEQPLYTLTGTIHSTVSEKHSGSPAPAVVRMRTIPVGSDESPRRRWPVVAIGGAIAVLVAVAFAELRGGGQRAQAEPQAAPVAAVPLASPPAIEPAPAFVITPSSSPAPTVSAPTVHKARNQSASRKIATVEKSAPAPDGVGYLTVNAAPWGAVMIDGRKVAEQTPAYRLPVAAGPHRVTVFNPERKAQSSPRKINLQKGEHQTIGFEW